MGQTPAAGGFSSVSGRCQYNPFPIPYNQRSVKGKPPIALNALINGAKCLPHSHNVQGGTLFRSRFTDDVGIITVKMKLKRAKAVHPPTARFFPISHI